MPSRLLFPTLVTCALLAGCGGGGEPEEAKADCPAPPQPLAGKPDLPAGFPSPTEVTYTENIQAGPSMIVRGYWGADIDEAFDGYKDEFDGTDYDVTKDEKEEVDAEVNFDGPGGSGQVKLIQNCRDRTEVSITIRP